MKHFSKLWKYLNKPVQEVATDLRKVGGALMVAAGIAAAAVVAPAPNAVAALPAAVATSFTEMEADFESIFGLAFAVLATVTVAMIAWRYTRKLGGKL